MLYKQQFTGTGTKKDGWYFNFPFFKTQDIKVAIDDAELAESQYAVHANSDGTSPDYPYTGGNIEFVDAPADGAKIEIRRDMELIRPVDYQPTIPPRSQDMNQDANFFLEVLKEFKHSLSNLSLLANAPDMQELLAQIAAAQEQIAALGDLSGFATSEDLQPVIETIESINEQITELQETLEQLPTESGYDNVIATNWADANGAQHKQAFDGSNASELPNCTANQWFRKYAGGWVEQGGRVTVNTAAISSTNTRVNFPIEMANNTYFAICAQDANSGTNMVKVGWQSITGMSIGFISTSGATAGYVSWEVKGVAA